MKRLSLLIAAFSLVLGAADWPQWRGPRRNGVSQETGLLKQWPKEGPKLLWQLKDIGDGYSTPAVAGGRVYVLSNRGMDNEFVQALSVEDGKQLWQTRLGPVGNPDQQPPYPTARSTATLDGDVLFVLSLGAARTDVNALGAAAAEAVARAIARGVTQAQTAGGVLGAGSL